MYYSAAEENSANLMVVQFHGGDGWGTPIKLTGDARYLEASERVARFFIAHIRPDGLTDCDFRQPPEPERIDNIAGACAACGLIELHRLTGRTEYLAAAEHEHWKAFMQVNGYMDGPLDELRQIHPNMVPYTEITQEQQRHISWLSIRAALLMDKEEE